MSIIKELIGSNMSRQRDFIAMEACEDNKMLRITFKEKIILDEVVISEEIVTYNRNYDSWKESTLGVAIFGMIMTDLTFENVQTKDGQFDEFGNPKIEIDEED